LGGRRRRDFTAENAEDAERRQIREKSFRQDYRIKQDEIHGVDF
jgi:hypothetical protein